MKKIKYFFTLLLLLGFSILTDAQGGNPEPVGKFMYSNQRSYVVIAVILTILTGLILYMVRLERKISKFEKNANS
ncbi:MAG: CcmD family protein [Bacteroidota bacterium]|nr:CcmD family protein [Bacteroidota bacterium]